MDIFAIQRALLAKGFDPEGIDGIIGPKTEAAISAFKASRGLLARPYIGPITLDLLLGATPPSAPTGTPSPPWVNELGRYLWKHETRDSAILRRWLASDGKTLGDPAKLPWCADAIQTAVRLTLPQEPFPGKVGANPYLARNWMDFGEPTVLAYGAIAIFWRGSRTGMSGHIGAAVGHDPRGKRLRIRGGNQSDMISDAWLDEARLLGYRKPKTWPHPLPPVPIMNSAGAVISTNEA